MAESVVELTWTEIVEAFAEIQAGATPSFTDGGGNFRTSLKNVWKRLYYMDEEPPSYNSLSVYPVSETYIEDGTNKEVIIIDVVFAIVAYMRSNSDQDASTKQSDLSVDSMALKHDLFRVVANLSTAFVNRVDEVTPSFIVDKNIKMSNAPGFGRENKGRFGFMLPVQIRWYERNLLP